MIILINDNDNNNMVNDNYNDNDNDNNINDNYNNNINDNDNNINDNYNNNINDNDNNVINPMPPISGDGLRRQGIPLGQLKKFFRQAMRQGLSRRGACDPQKDGQVKSH